MSIILVILVAGFLLLFSGSIEKLSKKRLAIGSLSAFGKAVKLLPINADTKKEIETIDFLVQEFTKEDNVSRRYLLMLQNNMELRPGGGFLGQYAVMEIKNGEVESLFLEDANILDQRIEARIKPPYPFKQLMDIKKWKFRDSNFSPDFPTNVEKAKYFYRLAGGNNNFDGVIAVNAVVLDHILELTGPVTVSGHEFNSKNAVLKLEEIVERPYIFNEDLDTQNRKWIMKKLAPEIVDRLFKLRNIPKIAELALEELRNKNVMLNLENQKIQQAVESVHWGGKVTVDWDGDYLMLVDANMGALKTDYYMRREIVYSVDLTVEKPMVTLEYTYTHNATHGDWRTSDYHSYLRIYAPLGSTLVERKMVGYPITNEEFGKTYFGMKADVLINRKLHAIVKYELPAKIKNDYRLLVQKQSGVGDVPLTVRIKTEDGQGEQKITLKKDVKFELK